MTARSVAAFLFTMVLTAAAVLGQAGADAPPKKKAPPPDPSVSMHGKAVDDLTSALHELAAWCEKQKLDRERARTLELVLAFRPDDEGAREALGYKRVAGGSWDRAPRWKEPGNRSTDGLQDFRKKRAEVGGAFLDAMTALLAEHRRFMEPELRAKVLGDMALIDANDARTRAAGGEIDGGGGKWVLAETPGARARRKQFAKFAAAAIKHAGTPEADEAIGGEDSYGVKWTAIMTTEHLRVMGTGSKEEILKIATIGQASGEFFQKVFDTQVGHGLAFRRPIYVLTNPNDKSSFLRNHPGIKKEEIEAISALGGTHVAGAAIAVWGTTAEARLDTAVRMLIGGFVGREFGLGTDEGALYEGLGLHLTWHLTGTRLTWTIGKRKYAQSGPDGLQEKLRGDESDWFAPGFDLLSSKKRPPLKPILAKHVNDLETEDLLMGYMLAVWLIEGQPEDAPRFLRAAGRNEEAEGCKDAFGLTLDALEERLARWAKESRR